jgi:hypothetical protein
MLCNTTSYLILRQKIFFSFESCKTDHKCGGGVSSTCDYFQAYLCIGWGTPFIAVGLNIYLQLLDMGDDPRCMVGYSNMVKWFFFVPVIFAAAFSLLAMLVVMCNLQAPALRKKSLVQDHSNLSKGVFMLVMPKNQLQTQGG